MTHTLVILGAGMAGIPLTGYLLRNIAPKVQGGLKVILVSPNTDFYWNLGVVRGILPDGGFPDEKLFFPIEPTFAAYGPDRFEFIVASATGLDAAKNTVTLSTGRAVRYDTLVIATGSRAREGGGGGSASAPPLKGLGATEDTRAALAEYRRRIAAASSVVVGGAGPTGVELAGELGHEYARTGRKAVTLLVNGALPLEDRARDDVRRLALRHLEDLGVRVITNAKVTAVREGGQKTTLELVDTATGKAREALETDCFVPAFGVAANTGWVPAHLLDGEGRIRQTRSLRVEGLDDSVFVVGDAGNLQLPTALSMDYQVQYLVKSLHARLTGGAKLPDFDPAQGVIFGVAIGKSTGTGQYNKWKMPGLLIWFAKCRFLGTDYAPVYAKGQRTILQTKW